MFQFQLKIYIKRSGGECHCRANKALSLFLYLAFNIVKSCVMLAVICLSLSAFFATEYILSVFFCRSNSFSLCLCTTILAFSLLVFVAFFFVLKKFQKKLLKKFVLLFCFDQILVNVGLNAFFEFIKIEEIRMLKQRKTERLFAAIVDPLSCFFISIPRFLDA